MYLGLLAASPWADADVPAQKFQMDRCFSEIYLWIWSDSDMQLTEKTGTEVEPTAAEIVILWS